MANLSEMILQVKQKSDFVSSNYDCLAYKDRFRRDELIQFLPF
jgi:hypothetical protein